MADSLLETTTETVVGTGSDADDSACCNVEIENVDDGE
jgi:hypothetical protein